MRSGIINASSPKEDIWGTLTGVWNHYRTGLNKQWLVTKTPFFVHMEATLSEGTHQLPIAPNSTKALYWTSRDDSGSIVIKAGQTGFTIPVASFVEITIFGNTDTNE